jgi:hypothetical protein
VLPVCPRPRPFPNPSLSLSPSCHVWLVLLVFQVYSYFQPFVNPNDNRFAEFAQVLG